MGAGGALALIFGLWAWNSSPINLKDRLFPKHLATVESSWLYRSGQISPALIEPTLRELDIDLILDLSHDRGERDASQLAEKEAARRLGIESVRVPLRGSGTGDLGAYARAVATLVRARQDGHRVLVHCRAGDRRTGGVLAAYQLLTRQDAGHLARRELDRFARRSANESGLTDFLDESLPSIAARLAEQGIETRPLESLPRLRDLRPQDSSAPWSTIRQLLGLMDRS